MFGMRISTTKLVRVLHDLKHSFTPFLRERAAAVVVLSESVSFKLENRTLNRTS